QVVASDPDLLLWGVRLRHAGGEDPVAALSPQHRGDGAAGAASVSSHGCLLPARVVPWGCSGPTEPEQETGFRVGVPGGRGAEPLTGSAPRPWHRFRPCSSGRFQGCSTLTSAGVFPLLPRGCSLVFRHRSGDRFRMPAVDLFRNRTSHGTSRGLLKRLQGLPHVAVTYTHQGRHHLGVQRRIFLVEPEDLSLGSSRGAVPASLLPYRVRSEERRVGKGR